MIRSIAILLTCFLYAQTTAAMTEGETIKLSLEAQFALKVDGDISLVKKLDVLDGGINVWAVAPITTDNKFHPFRIVYFFDDGRMLTGHVFDKDMNMLTLKYAQGLKDAVINKVFKLDDALLFTIGEGESKWKQDVIIFSSNDDWTRFVKLFSDLVSNNPVFQKVPFDVYYRPTGDSSHPSMTSLAWTSQGDTFRDNVVRGTHLDTLELASRQVSPSANLRLKSVIEDSNEITRILGLSTLGTQIAYRDRILALTETTTVDEVAEFILGFKASKL